MAVVPAVEPTIKFVRTRDSIAAGRKDILVSGMLRGSKNVFCRSGDCHRRIASLQFCHIRRLAILAKERRWCLGLLDSSCKMMWKCRLALSDPLSPLLLALLAVFALLLATVQGMFGRSSCCPGKRRRAGFGHHVRDERAEKRKKYRDCQLVNRRVRGKEAWQLLPEHREALDRFEEHLEVSVRVFPCPLAVSLTDANKKRFMWVSSSARAGNSLRSGSLSFCRSGPVVWPCCRNMASTIWRGDREQTGTWCMVASK
jgi:hypothetical protein